MKIDFSQFAFANRAFSEKPMTFCEPAHREMLASLIELVALETASHKALEQWQAAQLRNLLFHVSQRSAFWRRRLPAKKNVRDLSLSSLPVLTRADVIAQVQSEGPLILRTDPLTTSKSSTSGSSGTPVEFFVSDMNRRYNTARSLAQHFIEGRPLSLNRTKVKSGFIENKNGFTVAKDPSWTAGLDSFFKVGKGKYIEYAYPNIPKLLEELTRDPIGYLVTIPHFIEFVIQYIEPADLKRAGADYWLCLGGSPDEQIRQKFADVGIIVRASYSSEEVGPIGHECPMNPGHYHLAASNVIVELDKSEGIIIDGKLMGRVLITHLHSYATPFIRYDIGDLAQLKDSCPCGHNGPVLSDIRGRSKLLLKHPDGHLIPFYVRAGKFIELVKLSGYRIRQTDLRTIVVEIERPDPLTSETIEALKNMVVAHSGPGFDIEVLHVEKIDWGKNTKQLGFKNEILS
ncbi:MAG: hypothetical protein EPN75_09980 [Beijerinckiaceae bacterium]|nr:MAG: hypothetical protein EPN75_09980 [Beijerinckiaceae bacterium]